MVSFPCLDLHGIYCTLLSIDAIFPCPENVELCGHPNLLLAVERTIEVMGQLLRHLYPLREAAM